MLGTRMIRVVMWSLLGIIVAGCWSLGKKFSTDVSWIDQGKTRQTEVSKRLGIPQEMGLDSGVHFWTYYYYNVSVFEKTQRMELRIFWGPDLTVKRYVLTSSPGYFEESSGGPA